MRNIPIIFPDGSKKSGSVKEQQCVTSLSQLQLEPHSGNLFPSGAELIDNPVAQLLCDNSLSSWNLIMHCKFNSASYNYG